MRPQCTKLSETDNAKKNNLEHINEHNKKEKKSNEQKLITS